MLYFSFIPNITLFPTQCTSFDQSPNGPCQKQCTRDKIMTLCREQGAILGLRLSFVCLLICVSGSPVCLQRRHGVQLHIHPGGQRHLSDVRAEHHGRRGGHGPGRRLSARHLLSEFSPTGCVPNGILFPKQCTTCDKCPYIVVHYIGNMVPFGRGCGGAV